MFQTRTERSDETVVKSGLRTQIPMRLTEAEWNFLSRRCICSSPNSFLSVLVNDAKYNYEMKLYGFSCLRSFRKFMLMLFSLPVDTCFVSSAHLETVGVIQMRMFPLVQKLRIDWLASCGHIVIELGNRFFVHDGIKISSRTIVLQAWVLSLVLCVVCLQS